MHQFQIPWPDVRLYARDCGDVNPYDAANSALFRGEEAFAPDVLGWQRWSKPSPEPRLEAKFEEVCSVRLRQTLRKSIPSCANWRGESENVRARAGLIAVLRAGAPICALLGPLLEERFGESVPVCAFSLFYGLGWDEAALEQIIADFPGRELLFVDGWTSGGGVATQVGRIVQSVDCKWQN